MLHHVKRGLTRRTLLISSATWSCKTCMCGVRGTLPAGSGHLVAVLLATLNPQGDWDRVKVGGEKQGQWRVRVRANN